MTTLVPQLHKRVQHTILGTEIEASPRPFTWFRGYSTLNFHNQTSGYRWSMEIKGGGGGYSWNGATLNNTFFSYIKGTAIDSTFTPVNVTYPPPVPTVNTYTVVTNAPDSRTYVVNFGVFPPTIQKTAGAALPAGTQIKVSSEQTTHLPG